MKALNVRFAVHAFIAVMKIDNKDVSILSRVLEWIYPDDNPGDIKTQCSNIIDNNSFDPDGPNSKRIPYESVVAVLVYLNGNPQGALEKLNESISKDQCLEFTEELNNWPPSA